jgi:hypothetical protein
MFEIETYCLFAIVVGGGVGSVGHVLGLDRGAGGLGDLVVHGSASHLGHSVAVLNLHGDGLDDRVVNAVLGDDLTASVLDGGGDGVSHGVGGHGHGGDSVGNGDGGSVSGVSETVTKKVLGISISLGLSLGLTLGDGMVAVSDGGDNCETTHEILTTQTCVPSTENVCNTVTVDTEEIEYEKICVEVTDLLCDAPAVVAPVAHGYHAIAKREAEAEPEADADAQYLLGHGLGYAAHAAPVAVAHAVAPVPVAAHAVAHSVTATVKHACREVVTEHCVDNPIVKAVPVEVEHCHTVTKVTCTPVDNQIPKTTCTPVETQHVSHAAYAAPYHYGK